MARVTNSPRGRFRFCPPRRTMPLAQSGKSRGLGAEPPRRTVAWHCRHQGPSWEHEDLPQRTHGTDRSVSHLRVLCIHSSSPPPEPAALSRSHPSGSRPKPPGPRTQRTRPHPDLVGTRTTSVPYPVHSASLPQEGHDRPDKSPRPTRRSTQRDSGHGRKRSPRPATGAARELDEAAAVQSGLRV